MESHILGKDSLHFNVVEKVDWQNLPGFPGGFHLFFLGGGGLKNFGGYSRGRRLRVNNVNKFGGGGVIDFWGDPPHTQNGPAGNHAIS